MVQAPPKPKQQTRSSGTAVTAAPIVVRLPSGFLTDEMLMEISNLNDAWRFERNTEGALEISVPTGSIGGSRSMHVAGQLYAWWSTHEEGMVFDSSTGFRLPGDSVRSPDSAWASSHSIQDMQPDDEGYWMICPDFVVEVVSAGQESQKQQEKMLELMAAGARLGWLIDPFTDEGIAWIYREGTDEPDRLERPDSLSGEGVAEGLIVDLAKVWR
ncbi:MAG: Uma2 family endonuclease [Chloroflexi bacterium]|nr:Uma2 family endonuclease [Chloroflexota bacterium]